MSSTSSTPRRLSKKTWIFAGSALVIVAVVVLWLTSKAGKVHGNDARIEGEVLNISSRLDGWVTKRPVTEGDHIKKGQLLAVVDDRTSTLDLSTITAQIGAAEETVNQLQAEKDLTDKQNSAAVDEAQANLQAAKASMNTADHQLTLAQSTFKRTDKLLKKGLTNHQQWDDDHTALLQASDQQQQAQADYSAAQAKLSKAQATLGQTTVLNSQIQVEQQQIQALKSQAAQTRQNIADLKLLSPIDGVVDKTLIDNGDYAQAGQWLMLIHDPSKLWVEANIKETKIGSIKVGQTVDIHVDAYPNATFTGTVTRVGNAATNQFALLPSPNPSGNFTKITQRVPVRIHFDHLDPRLKPGLMVEVDIHVGA
ncbi:HlyD family secretion protein [Gallaecimonas mangrovi]|uniref:HlyD family secretion protein n=1 Tax=Gallaecimonas mangrovi TaxID=2291597 RepID=UPI001D008F8A|nr:HlyD family secretion protein [Gallaecimonas mangrovi]